MLLGNITSASLLLPLGVGLARYRKLSADMRLFFYFICVSSLVEAVIFYTSIKGRHNLWVANIYCVIEFAFLAFIFRKWLGEKMNGRLSIFIILGLVTLGLLNLLYDYVFTFDEFYFYNKYNLTIERILLLLLSGYFLINLAITTEKSPLRNPKFWAASGVFFYFTSTIVIFSFADFFTLDMTKDSWDFFNTFHSIINIFGNIIYAIAFLCKEPETK